MFVICIPPRPQGVYAVLLVNIPYIVYVYICVIPHKLACSIGGCAHRWRRRRSSCIGFLHDRARRYRNRRSSCRSFLCRRARRWLRRRILSICTFGDCEGTSCGSESFRSLRSLLRGRTPVALCPMPIKYIAYRALYPYTTWCSRRMLAWPLHVELGQTERLQEERFVVFIFVPLFLCSLHLPLRDPT
jgi:hypothetical protein